MNKEGSLAGEVFPRIGQKSCMGAFLCPEIFADFAILWYTNEISAVVYTDVDDRCDRRL